MKRLKSAGPELVVAWVCIPEKTRCSFCSYDGVRPWNGYGVCARDGGAICLSCARRYAPDLLRMVRLFQAFEQGEARRLSEVAAEAEAERAAMN